MFQQQSQPDTGPAPTTPDHTNEGTMRQQQPQGATGSRPLGHLGKYQEWEQHNTAFPTLPNCAANIVGETRNERGQLILTVQCAACHSVYTDIMILALHQVNHALGDNVWGPAGTTPYKRCHDCRTNDRHPEVTA